MISEIFLEVKSTKGSFVNNFFVFYDYGPLFTLEIRQDFHVWRIQNVNITFEFALMVLELVLVVRA